MMRDEFELLAPAGSFEILKAVIKAGADAVETIIATLPVCAVRGVAYSTFTVLHFVDNNRAEIIQYDNPRVILLRNGKNYEIPTSRVSIAGKEILRSEIELQENDVFIAFSDGVEHAGVGGVFSFGWRREDIITYVEDHFNRNASAMETTSVLLDECERLYDGRPGDDATVCTVRIRPSQSVNLLYGPPSNRNDCYKMMSQFFGTEGKHIVCGGTTSTIASQYLDKPGIPRMINRICEKSLMYASQQGKRLIDEHTVAFVMEHEMLDV